MQYAILGRTGLRVSRLGFGGMRLPMKGDKVDRDKTIPMIHRAFQAGVNYIDTAVGYCNRDSQRAVGEALKGWRQRIVVSTKNPYYNKADDRPWWKNLEDSLRRLGVETIDIYNFHSLRWQSFVDHVRGRDGQLRWMQKARDQGLIRYICFSFHDTAEALRKLAETGEFDAVTLQYNLLDRSNEPALGTCKKAGMGVVVMGPVGGGRLGSPSEAIQKMIPGARSVPEVALRFVLANPNVTVALSGMNEMRQVAENLHVASKRKPLSPAEKRRVTATLRRYKKLADLYCTGCNYCMPCPTGVDIPRNFLLLNQARVYGLEELAKQHYRRLGGKASVCLACGKCLEKCPQHIDIISQLRETVRTLDEAYGKLVVTVTPTEVARWGRRNGRFDGSVKCRVECHNLSDTDAEPQLSFSPGKNVAAKLTRQLGRLGAFQRRLASLYLEVKSLREGQPLRLGPSVAAPMEMLFGHDPLRVAIAPKAPRRSPETALKRAPLVRAETVARGAKPSARARASHALAARFAYGADALIAQFDARGAFRRPATARRGVRRSDALWVRIDLSQARGIKGAKNRPKQFDIALGFPAKSGPMPASVFRPRLGAEQVRLIRAEATGRGRRRRVLVRIPWKLLQVEPPEPGARLGVNFGMTCWPARGRASWRLAWAEGYTPHLLLTK